MKCSEPPSHSEPLYIILCLYSLPGTIVLQHCIVPTTFGGCAIVSWVWASVPNDAVYSCVISYIPSPTSVRSVAPVDHSPPNLLRPTIRSMHKARSLRLSSAHLIAMLMPSRSTSAPCRGLPSHLTTHERRPCQGTLTFLVFHPLSSLKVTQRRSSPSPGVGQLWRIPRERSVYRPRPLRVCPEWCRLHPLKSFYNLTVGTLLIALVLRAPFPSQEFPWYPKPLNELCGSTAAIINEQPCLIWFSGEFGVTVPPSLPLSTCLCVD